MLAALSPATAGNQPLRQCLTGFFPVYSYMSAKNQKSMTDVCHFITHCVYVFNFHQIFLHVFSEVKKSRAELEEDEEVVTATQVANMFVDLTDPNRLASVVCVVVSVGVVFVLMSSVHLGLRMGRRMRRRSMSVVISI